MKYLSLPKQNLVLSRIALGTDRFCLHYEKEQQRLLGAAVEAGIQTLDTAAVYGQGEAERSLGRHFRSLGRNRFVIVAKGGFRKETAANFERALRRELEDSLRRLKTDRVEFFLLHRDPVDLNVGLVADCLEKLRSEGKILAAGVSNWNQQRLQDALSYAMRKGLAPFSISSVQGGLVFPKRPLFAGAVSLTGTEQETKWYRESGLVLFAYSPLGHGTIPIAEKFPWWKALRSPYWFRHYLSCENYTRVRRAISLAKEKGQTPIQIGLAYLLSKFPRSIAVIRCRTAAEIQSNALACEIGLSSEEVRWLENGVGITGEEKIFAS
jgi:aryl-alcohol dehydrogenase-like predicted oxidoreductase